MNKTQKIYTVVRRDLSPGAQACQALHAFREFQARYPKKEQEWYETSNHVCILSVANLHDLQELRSILKERRIKHAVFHEPDFDNELTAITIEPTKKAREICAHLPLALREFDEKE